MPKCEYKNSEGIRCKAWALNNSHFCFSHCPSNAGARLQAQRRGGESLRLKYETLPPIQLQNASDISKMLEELINLVREEKIPSSKATLLQKISDSLLKSLEIRDTDAELQEILNYLHKNPNQDVDY